MPFRTEYGTHYHMIEGCHGADIPCDTKGLTPCSDCCGAGSSGSDGGGGMPIVGGGVPSTSGDGSAEYTADGEYVADGSDPSEDASEIPSFQPEMMDMGIESLSNGIEAIDPDGIPSPAAVRHISESAELASAPSGLYTSRAVPELIVSEDEVRTVAKVLAMYIDSGTYVIGHDEDGGGLAFDRDFKRVLSGMMSDLVPVMPKAEHEERARRELLEGAERDVAHNYRAVDHLEPCPLSYLPFSSYPVKLEHGNLINGIPGASGWDGVPFVDAPRDGRWNHLGTSEVWDYLPGPFETHEDVPITLSFGNYRLEATINCGISPVPGKTIKGDYDYDKVVEAPAPAIPRVERVRLTRVIHNGAPIDIGEEIAQDDGDFDAFRHRLENLLAEQEQQNRPAFGVSRMSRGGEAFTRYCIDRDNKARKQAEIRRRNAEQRKHDREERAKSRAARMSKYSDV